MHSTEFFAALPISRSSFFVYVRTGDLPAPPRRPGSRHIRWSRAYLRTCRRALRERMERERARSRITKEQLDDLRMVLPSEGIR